MSVLSSRTKLTLVLLLAAAALLGRTAPALAQTDPTPNLVAEFDKWGPNDDGGNPPRITREASVQASGTPALRLRYTDREPHWGNVAMEVTVPPTARAINLRLYKHSSSEEAALHVWLIEPDKDRWAQQVLFQGKPFGAIPDGWHETEAAIGAFTFDPRGDKKKGITKARKLLIGCNYGDIDVSFSEVRFALAGEIVRSSAATLPPPQPVEGPSGRIAILSENFVIRERKDEPTLETDPLEPTDTKTAMSPSAADPSYLAEMAERAGYGVTLISASALGTPGYLSPANFDLLVMPSAPYYPIESGKAISHFLQSGGSLFTTGGYAFDTPCVQAGDAWLTVERAITASDIDEGKTDARLNHRYGIPADGQGPAPGQIPLFDPSYPLKNAQYAETLVDFIPRIRLDGPFEGWAASALLGSNNPVFPKAYARRIPLLMTYDATGRPTGALGQIVHNFDGPFKGSSWAAFGVTNQDLFGRSGPLALEFTRLLDLISRKVYLHGLQTDLALYKPGEPVAISVKCANFTKERVKVMLRFEIATAEGVPVEQLTPPEREVAAGFDDRIEVLWNAPASSDGSLYRITCEMTFGNLTDEIATSFLMDSEDVRKSGAAVTASGGYLQVDGKPALIIGTNQTGAIFSSRFEDPGVWDSDLRQMRSMGLRMMRVLHFSPYMVSQTGSPPATPMDLAAGQMPKWLERRLDALVQLTAKHRIALQLTLHDWMGLDLSDEELQAQKKFARLVAERYASCPHLLFDIQNEPSVDLNREDPGKALLNRFLTDRYGSQEKLAAAWGQYLSGQTLGQVTLERGPEEWANIRSADLDRFRLWLLERWNAAHVDAVREVSKALVTVGYIQNMTAADQLSANTRLDLISKHYYGDKKWLPHEIKAVDLRYTGKPFALGEFGSVLDHDARIQGSSQPITDYDWYLEAIGAVFGLGGSAALNWCWKEMPDNVFPWGVNTPNDNIPRETLAAMRALSLVTSSFTPAYSDPEVFVVASDCSRLGSTLSASTNALYRAIDAVIQQRVPFSVLPESGLSKLPASARVLIAPAVYCLSDEARATLKTFVTNGGTLYLSGDPSYDAARVRSRDDFFREMCGVQFEGSPPPPMQVAGSAPAIKAATATPVEGSSLWSNAVGKGRVIYSPSAEELKAVPYETVSRVLEAAGVQPLAIEPADPALIVYPLAGASEGDLAIFLHNRSPQPQQTMLPHHASLTLDPGAKSVVIYTAGRVTALMAKGKVVLGDKLWGSFGQTCAAVSLDGKALSESLQIALAPMEPGEIRLQLPSTQELRVTVGELDGDKWRALALRTPQRLPSELLIPTENALGFGLILIAPPDESSKAAEALVGRLAPKPAPKP